MNNIDTEYAVRISKQFVNLFVDEWECVEHYWYKNHYKNFTEKYNINTDNIGHKVDPENNIQNIFRKIVFQEWQLVNGS